MTTPMDDALTAIGRQLSDTYVPTVQEPLPRELKNLVLQLVAIETRKGRSCTRRPALRSVVTRLAPDSSSTDPSTIACHRM